MNQLYNFLMQSTHAWNFYPYIITLQIQCIAMLFDVYNQTDERVIEEDRDISNMIDLYGPIGASLYDSDTKDAFMTRKYPFKICCFVVHRIFVIVAVQSFLQGSCHMVLSYKFIKKYFPIIMQHVLFKQVLNLKFQADVQADSFKVLSIL